MKFQIDVERFAKCPAKFIGQQTVRAEFFDDEIARLVESYELRDHATAKKAFAWLNDSGEIKITLGGDGIHSADQAVQVEVRGAEKKHIAVLLDHLLSELDSE